MPLERSSTAKRARGRIGQRPLVAIAIAAPLLAIFTVGNVGQSTSASLRDTTTGDIATVQAASIEAVSDLTAPPSVVYSAGMLEKTGGLTITNSGTIDAAYRTVTTATGAAPLLSGVKVHMWPSTVAGGCLSTPVTAITGTWASFPALSGSLPAGGSQFYCVKTVLTTPVGHASDTAVTATFATMLSRSNWTSAATSTVTQSFKDAPPSAPSGLFFSGTTSASTTLNWTASTDDVAVTGYDVYRGTTLVGSTTGATSLIITGLTPSTSYSYTVKAKDGAGHTSTTSPLASITTLSVTAPSGWFQLVNSKSQMCIDASGAGTANFTPLIQYTCSTPAAANQQWSFSGPNAAGYYTVVPRHSSSVIWDVEAASSNNAARIILYGPNSGTNQQWSVIAVGTDKYQFVARNSGKCMAVVGGSTASGASFEQVTCNSADPAQTFSLRTTVSTPPAAPNNLIARTAGSSSISLSWNAPSNAVGVTGYVIYRNNVALSQQTSDLSFVDTGLRAGTAYNYVVYAKNAAGQLSAASNTATASTSTVNAPPLLTCKSYDAWYLEYSWTAPTTEVLRYDAYLNGVLMPVSDAWAYPNKWWPVLQLNSANVPASLSGTVPVEVKQIRPDGSAVSMGTGKLRIGTSAAPYNCG
ncbi:RICIN domain-containing protein [Mycetocola zhadangensis]|uniref:RICIN domain-containing protein n=1 Tax=Mycetocola zhadangensis TaxID=1164595 RepID=UPI003A4E2B33